MGTSLNLLLVESHPGVADAAAEQLTAEGHAVHRCHEAGGAAFPCVGVASSDHCPIDRHVDAALLVRRGVAPAPTQLEDGVPCALRAGIPVVEDGTDLLDPYAEFVTARVGLHETVPEALHRAVRESMRGLAEEVAASLVPFLASNGMGPDEVAVELESSGDTLRIHLTARSLSPMLIGQLSVKAADTVRTMRRSWSSIEVTTAEMSGDAPSRD